MGRGVDGQSCRCDCGTWVMHSYVYIWAGIVNVKGSGGRDVLGLLVTVTPGAVLICVYLWAGGL